MNGIIHTAARLVLAAQKAGTRKWAFLALSLCTFFMSVTVLAAADLLPEVKTVEAQDVTLASSLVAPPSASLSGTSTITNVSEVPVKIEIPKISLSVSIANPTSTAIEVLDEALLKGAVRYPTSAKLGEAGNVVIFAHASYLPVVNNQAFKAFNGIQKLKEGDTVTVYASKTAYTYRVKSVSKEDATSAGIPLTVSGKVLTLSTCDSFGSTSDRFVVVADFVESHQLSS